MPTARTHTPVTTRARKAPPPVMPKRGPAVVPEDFRVVLEGTPMAMVMVDRSGIIVLVNGLAEQLFGYPKRELIGRAIETLVPERFRAGHPGDRDAFLAKPTPRVMGAGRDLFALRKDGREVPVEIGLSPLKTRQGVFVLASIVDITERRRAEERLRLT